MIPIALFVAVLETSKRQKEEEAKKKELRQRKREEHSWGEDV